MSLTCLSKHKIQTNTRNQTCKHILSGDEKFKLAKITNGFSLILIICEF